MSDTSSPAASSEGNSFRSLQVRLPAPIVAWIEEQARARGISVSALLAEVLTDRIQTADETGPSSEGEGSSSSSGSIVDSLRSASERLQKMTRSSSGRRPDVSPGTDRSSPPDPESADSDDPPSSQKDGDKESTDSPSMFDLLDD
jgi:hypothetical protein